MLAEVFSEAFIFDFRFQILEEIDTENGSRNIPNTVCGLVGTFLISAKMFLLPCVLWAISGTISNMFLIPNNIRNTLSCS